MTTSTFHVSHMVRGSMTARETVRCFRVTAESASQALGLAEAFAGYPSIGEWRCTRVDGNGHTARVRELAVAA